MANTSFAFKWFKSKNWEVFPFQEEAWEAFLEGYSGLVNAPTGSGKTYSLMIPAALQALQENNPKGCQLIWVTPIRALSKEIHISSKRAVEGIGLEWDIAIRNGDTSPTERQKQWNTPPHMLITTPESLHVMMCKKNYESFFSSVKAVVIDEWHELMGSKRGVQTELFCARMRGINPDLKLWGISATIGNMNEAIDVLLGHHKPKKWKVVKAIIEKEIVVKTLLPDEVEKYPWSGHLGLKMMPHITPIIHNSKTTLIFTNTRALCEIWYQKILDADPDLAGLIAMHHGSLSRHLRDWVEEALYEGKLKAVVCTSSLDLGVDFRPVESIIQIGSPKGIARFVQRAGRSGHRPGEVSRIYFAPTHSLELIEAAALREAIGNQSLEERIPYIRSYDVLIQFLMTLAVSDGFNPEKIYNEILVTYSFFSVTPEEFKQCIDFLTHGSSSLQAYDEYAKIAPYQSKYLVVNKHIAQRHKLSIGTIVSDAMLTVKFVRGKKIGTIEEFFLSQLAPGDAFWFAGQPLELVRIKDMTAQVSKSKKKNSRIPSYMGGRMPLSSEMSKVLRRKIEDYHQNKISDIEIKELIPLLEQQKESSLLPRDDEFLIEYFETKEGFHLLMYPFEGRQVHEGMAALLAQRISLITPISFSIAMNDYGLELLSDTELDIESIFTPDLFSTINLAVDIQASINAVEMARRRFRDIAKISGLIFQGYPGREKRDRHLQSSSSLLFNVFKEYEPNNLLYLQTYEEVMTFQLEEARMRSVLERIQQQSFILMRPSKISPFAFPLVVDRLREKMSTERLENRIEKMKLMTFR